MWPPRTAAPDAIELFAGSTYPPKAVPVLRFLATGDGPLHWTFDLIDMTTQTPTFRWDDPVAIRSDRGFANA